MSGKNLFRKIPVFLSLILFCGVHPDVVHASYEVQGLGFLESTVNFSTGYDINNMGQAVGRSLVTHNSVAGREAFLWDPVNKMQTLGDFPGGSDYNTAEAVNEAGQAAGSGSNGTVIQATYWSQSTGMLGLQGFSGISYAYGINNSGQVVGKGISANGDEAFIWSLDSGLQFLGDFPGGEYKSVAMDINHAGLVVGGGVTSQGWQAFVWDQTKGMRALEIVSGFNSCSAEAINNSNPAIIAGTCWTTNSTGAMLSREAVIWDADTRLSLGLLTHPPGTFPTSIPRDINDAGQVVGEYSGGYPFLYDPGSPAGMVDLRNLITTPGWILTRANGINNSGQIVGEGKDPNGHYQAVILNPGTYICTPSLEICNDRIDNDCDGQTDCADSDCALNIDCITCYDNSDCSWPSSGKYCQKTINDCSGPGRCKAPPSIYDFCAAVIACGCDGLVYPTPCDAARQGVNLVDCCSDNDGDGYSPSGGGCGLVDCNDNNPAIHPGAAEIIDGLDNNCNGLIDEILAKAVPPTFSLPGGTYGATQAVVISTTTTQARIRYTTDGTLPTATDGTEVANGSTVVVDRTLTVKAVAYLVGGTPSGVVSATYTLKAALPVLAPLGGTYLTPQTLTGTSPTAGASIRYTIDGTTPTCTPPNGALLTNGWLSLDRSMVLKAIVCCDGWTASGVVSATYTFRTTLPVLSVIGGTYVDTKNVTITTLTPGASIRFTTDGVNLPTATVGTDLANGGTVVVDRSMTLKAIAYRDGWIPTTAVSATYTLKAATPTLSPPGTTNYTPQSVTITSATTGATVSYTTDGSTPSQTNGIQIPSGGTVPVDRSLTLKAVAFKPGWTDTTVVSGIYAFRLTQPLLTPPGGTYSAPLPFLMVTMTTPAASIQYTTDGTTPVCDQPQVLFIDGGLVVNRSMVLKLIACRDGWTPSSVVSATYTFKAATPTLSPLGTTYYTPQSVAINSATPGTTISYTTDGSTPSQTNGTQIPNGATVPVDRSLTLKAVAFMPGWTDTTAASGAYTFRATIPVFSQPGGTFTDTRQVTISTTTEGALIRYTTDGVTLPTNTVGAVIANGGTVAVDRSLTLKAVAYRDGWTPTTVVSNTYTLKAATPTLSLLGTTYYTPQNVAINSATLGTTISYTTDGSTPSQTNGTQIPNGATVPVDRSLTLKAVAFKPGWTDTTAVSGTYTFRATLPLFSQLGGTFTDTQNVTISTATVDALIRFTTDGVTLPTNTVGAVIANGGTVAVDRSLILKAVAYRDGWTPTTVVSTTYTLKAATPKLSPPGTTYYTPQSVTIASATTGTTISYTTDGSTPSQTNGTQIPSGGTVPVNYSLTLKAVAFKPGWTDTTLASGTYTLRLTQPLLTPPSGTYSMPLAVTIATTSPAISIEYTTDGTTPVCGLHHVLIVGGSLVVNRSMVLKVIACRDGWTPSGPVSATYTLKAATPTLSPPGTTCYTPQSVAINSATPGTTISYTTDGSTPSQTNGHQIPNGATVPVDRSLTLKAVAFMPGWTDTTAVSGTYTFRTTLPVLSQLGGTFTEAQNVTISTTTEGALIRYTTDGVTLPTSTVGAMIANGGMVAVDRSLTLKAVAYRDGWTPTTAVSATYTLKAATPVFSPIGGTFSAAQNVTIASATTGASISYTTDGSLPSPTTGILIASGGSLLMDRSMTIRAVAFKSGWTDSAIGSAAYFFKAATTYTYTVMPLPEPDATLLAPYDVNNDGVVVGEYFLPSSLRGNTSRAFIYSGGRYTVLLPPWLARSMAEKINNRGVVVGHGQVDGGQQRGFIYEAGTFKDIFFPGWISTEPHDINEDGVVVGEGMESSLPVSEYGNYRCFVYSGGSYTRLHPPGWLRSNCTGINNAGTIVGQGYDAAGTWKSFIYGAGTFTEIMPAGSVRANVVGINDVGIVVGAAEWEWETELFAFNSGTYSMLHPSGLESPRAWAVNNLGQIVGDDSTGGFVYSGGSTSNLLPAGWNYGIPYGINDTGVVVGEGQDANWEYHGFIAIPNNPVSGPR